MLGRALERGRHVRVRPVDRERKVARPLLLVVDDVGEAAVELAPCEDVEVLVRRGSEERMGEAEAVAVELEDVRLEGGPQRVRLVSGLRRSESVGWERAAAAASALRRRRGQRVEPVADELAELLGHR